MSDITPEKVAVLLAEDDDNGFYSDKVGGWVTFEAKGASVQVKVAHHDEAGEEVPDQTQHFRAVVVEGERAPIVIAPEILTAARALYRAYAVEGSESAEQAAHTRYQVDAALYALTAEQAAFLAERPAEAAQMGGDDA